MTPDDETRVFVPSTPASGPEALVGRVIAGRYQIEELLGVGAMGAVYLGKHLKIGRRDAIKVLNAAMARDPDAIARFDRGARNVGAIRHPNVCIIYDFSDTDDGLQYLAMEYVKGESLKDLIDREGPLPLQRGADIIEQAASALQAAHKAGVIHRDLKPANMMIARGADGEDLVKVVDFDISKGSSEGAAAEVTRVGFVVGTPEYMSPEQLLDSKLDGRSDVYSLALVLVKVLTGGLPFRGDTLQEVMTARLTDAPLMTLEEIAPGRKFPAALQKVIDGALQRRVADRTASAAEFASQLRAAVHGTPVVPQPTHQPAPVSGGKQELSPTVVQGAVIEPAKKSRLFAIAGGVTLAGAIGVFAVMKFGGGPGDELLQNPDSAAQSNTGIAAAANDPVTADSQNAAPVNNPGPNVQQPIQNPGSRQTGGGTTPQNNTTPNTTPNTTTSNPPAPVANPLVARASDILTRYQPLVGTTSAAQQRSMRDTTALIYNLSDLPGTERAKAANIAALISGHLKEKSDCTTWVGRARELTPTRYAGTVTLCQNLE